MSEYEDDHFEADTDQKHLLRLSIDLFSVKDMKVSANLCLSYTINLNKTHTFKSSPPTAVNQGQEVKLANAFATYEFQATKTELYNYLNDAVMMVNVVHQDKSGSSSEIGQVTLQLKEIFQAPQKKTP